VAFFGACQVDHQEIVASRSKAVQALAGDEEKRGIVCEAVVADARQPRRDSFWLPVHQTPPSTPAQTPHSSNFTILGRGIPVTQLV